MSCVEEIVKTGNVMAEKGPRRISPHFIPRILGNMAAGHVCIRYGLQGPVFSPSTACATGASAIGEGFRSIRNGDAKVMLVGATESCIDPLSMAGFCQAKALATKFDDSPGEASRPFDKHRDGFVMGEGGAILVLEDLEFARARDAKPLAEVVGYGIAADAHHIVASHPEGIGPQLAMRRALKEAAIAPQDVHHINTHGTSTDLGDKAELFAIDRVFGDNIPLISSTKGATGHLLSGAGAVEAAFTVLSVYNVSTFHVCT